MPHPAPHSSDKRSRAPRIGFASLGCPKGLVDSERILTQLRAEGHETVSGFEEADLVVVNTCGLITSAIEESLETIGETLAENACRRRRRGRTSRRARSLSQDGAHERGRMRLTIERRSP